MTEPTLIAHLADSIPIDLTHVYVRFFLREGELSADGRVIDPNAINFNRQPPLPIRLQTAQPETGGHAGAEVCGVITNLMRDGLVIIADGVVDIRIPAGYRLMEMASPGPNGEPPILQTWSPDFGDVIVDEEQNAVDEDGTSPRDTLLHVVEGTIIGFTVVALPALSSAVFELQDAQGNVISVAPIRSGEDAPDSPHAQRVPQDAAVTISTTNPLVTGSTNVTINGQSILPPSAPPISPISACAGPSAPPASWFTPSNLSKLGRWIDITADGRISGLASTQGECHIGILDRCVTPEDIADGIDDDCNFEYAMPGHTITAEGHKVATGPLPIKGGHADKSLSWQRAMAHYDDPSTAIADVAYFRTPEGHIAFSGALRSGVTEEQVRIVRASGVSLDARRINDKLRYLATCCVNTPGFPKMTLRASIHDPDAKPVILALIAAGGPPIPSPDDCGCDELDESSRNPTMTGGTMTNEITNPTITELAAQIRSLTAALETVTARLDADEEFATLADDITASASFASGRKNKDGAIRLGGWRWSNDEKNHFTTLAPKVLGGWRWANDPTALASLAKVLGGWRWAAGESKEDAEASLTKLLGGWRWSNGDEAAISAKLLGGWRWAQSGD